MVKSFVNYLMRWYCKLRYNQLVYFMKHPKEIQLKLLDQFIKINKHTEWGQLHEFNKIKDYQSFTENVPLQDYETLKSYILRMMNGEKDILWGGVVKWFSKSSGTTSDKSKFIPVSDVNLRTCHIRGSWYTTSILYSLNPEMKIFSEKSMLMGGSLYDYPKNPNTKFGDVSAIMISSMPWIGRPFFTPELEVALLPNWDEKIEKIAQSGIHENVVMLGGVPTWTIVLFRRMLEITGKKDILEIWPNFQVYIHGGVSFEPYRKQFEQFLPSKKVIFQEIYNASEGFFAIQNDFENNDLLLLLDNGIFYEFIPMSDFETENQKVIPIWEVKEGQNYAIVITTNSGLWRYVIGDTVMFTSTDPYKIKITGRTRHFVNAFGEEVMITNTDQAIAATCHATGAMVSEYTMAPIYFSQEGKGSHEWLIEFEKPPPSVEEFINLLDENLKKINSDYEAKRFKGMALERPHLHSLPLGTFHKWMKTKGKYGGQNKVPRLANHRKYVEEILLYLSQ
ncbi:MAG: GH3 auxin-responsive promoter family protein [Saprospiraceae bacterium]|nr:GH3 auxin-responsive promoter family protein [Saprospiraceae bacterium]